MQINKIQHSEVDGQRSIQKEKPVCFAGAGSAALNGASRFFQLCDDIPMIGVAVTDTCATNVPRTVVDFKQTGVPAAKETARREFSGLFVNCLIPGAFVWSAAKMLNNSYMKDFKTGSNKIVDMSGFWANGEAINNLTSVWRDYAGLNCDIKELAATEQQTAKNGLKTFKSSGFVKNALSKIEGLNGVNSWDKLSNHKELINEVSNILEPVMNDEVPKGALQKLKYNKAKNNALKQAYNLLINGEYTYKDSTGAKIKKVIEDGGGFKASHALKFDGREIGSDLRNFLRDTTDIGSVFARSEAARINPNDFAKKAAGLVTSKSLAGLAVVIPLAMSMQYINRAITRHKYKKSGAPIYKDFENEQRVLSDSEKKKLTAAKPLAVGSIVGLAALSMGKGFPKSLGQFAEMLQFNTKFPTLNQCRVIATSTFASRMMAAEDPNELRESTVRDLASFAGLYFLGDYAEKLAATGIQKFSKKGKSGELEMFNKTKNDSEYKNIPQKFIGWIKDTNIKTFDEIPKEQKNYRSLAKIGGLGFSLLFLGVLLPLYNKHVTNKKEAKRKELLEQQKQAAISDAPFVLNQNTPVQNPVLNNSELSLQDTEKTGGKNAAGIEVSKPLQDTAGAQNIGFSQIPLAQKWIQYQANPAFAAVALNSNHKIR